MKHRFQINLYTKVKIESKRHGINKKIGEKKIDENRKKRSRNHLIR
jgi:hypothetical protein